MKVSVIPQGIGCYIKGVKQMLNESSLENMRVNKIT